MNENTAEIEGTIKQQQMFSYINDDTVREILYGGSAGSAKSFGICLLMINLCISYDNIRIGLARNDLTTLKKTTIVSFFEVIDVLRQKYNIKIQFKYNSIDGKITFANSSVIQLYELKYMPSDPKYTRLGGALLTLGFIDEVGEIDKRGYDIFKSRINRYRNNELVNNATGEVGIKGQLYMTCNPVKGWLYNEFYRKWREDELPENKVFIQALPTDNPFLPKEYIEILNDLPDVEKQRLLYGNWDYDDSPYALINYENTQLLYSLDTIYQNQNREHYLIADIAFTTDRLVIMIWRGYELIDIYSSINDEDKPEDLIKEYAKKYQIKMNNILYDADGAGMYLKNYFSGAVGFHGGGKVFKDENYMNLKTQLAYKFADLVNKNMIRIRTEDYRTEIEEELSFLQTYKVDLDGKLRILPKSEIKKILGHSPDFMDTLIYRAYYEYKTGALPTFFAY